MSKLRRELNKGDKGSKIIEFKFKTNWFIFGGKWLREGQFHSLPQLGNFRSHSGGAQGAN